MRENDSRTMNPSAYTTPASVFNTLAVDIDSDKSEPSTVEQNELPLRTVILPAAELLKLDPIASNKAKVENDIYVQNDSPSKLSLPSNDPTSIQQAISPNPCEIIGPQNHDPSMQYAYHFDMNAQQQQNTGMAQHFQSITQNQQLNNNFIYSSSLQNQQFIPSNMNFFHQNASNSLPPQQQQSDGQKSRSLERSSALGFVSRMSSLERIQNAQKAVRSNSLTRQLSAGPETYSLTSRSSSFERNNVGASLQINQQTPQPHGCRANSLERNQQMQTAGHRGGSLERNQSVASTYDLMKNRGYRGGSLERNQQAMIPTNRAGSLERNQQFSMVGYRNQMKPPEAEPFQEEIYDFGGANVKSCASIALSKSMSKGMNPSGVSSSQQQLPTTQSTQNSQLNQIPQSQHYHPYPLSPQQVYASQNMIYTQMHPSRIWSGGSQHQQQQNILRSLPPTAQNQSSFSQGSSVKLQLPQQHQQSINVQTNPHSLNQSSASVQVCSFTTIFVEPVRCLLSIFIYIYFN